MRVAIVSFLNDKQKLLELKEFLKDHKIVRRNPQLVVCYGGDGTLLSAEEKFPGVKKLFFYKTCRKFKFYENYKDYFKLDVFLNGKKMFCCLNDVNVHYNLPRALRFSVEVNHFDWGKGLIGDGVIVSTPFGANGYYRTIVNSGFTKGIGIAFNNVIRKKFHKVVDENSKILITIDRETGILGCDSCDRVYKLKKGDRVLIRKSKERTSIARRE
ncbi:hypothetical protein HOD38_05240 [archaeon]|jgi:NAD kinase|nr:hypothetical protein [archaeon]MBT4397644.1 hypothetical protein [archaeon]MBT4441660.1 hypothetical protein [archaeon]